MAFEWLTDWITQQIGNVYRYIQTYIDWAIKHIKQWTEPLIKWLKDWIDSKVTEIWNEVRNTHRWIETNVQHAKDWALYYVDRAYHVTLGNIHHATVYAIEQASRNANIMIESGINKFKGYVEGQMTEFAEGFNNRLKGS